MMAESTADRTWRLLRAGQPCLWGNPGEGDPETPDPLIDRLVCEARDRLDRAQPLLGRLFPEVGTLPRATHSPLLPADSLAAAMGSDPAIGQWWIKADHQLPIAGSVKARGGFHEVIAHAERLALAAGLLEPGASLEALASPDCRAHFARHSILVGSTGNLGLSIGLIAQGLGFKAVIHMSSDAKEWKKQRLRDRGVTVVEHAGDYAAAVERGRREAEEDPLAHFVDDERSLDLFVGYAAAAWELAGQFTEQGVAVAHGRPLFVYIPCGVGGAPGGIAYGLRTLFGDNVHCFFAEPVASPCMLVQMLAGTDRCMSVYDIGLDNRTEADGLAVGQASMLVAPLMETRLAGIYTVSDEQLYDIVGKVHRSTGVEVEPSAAAGFAGPLWLSRSSAGRDYLDRRGLSAAMPQAVHVVWTTGGSLVPSAEMQRFLERGERTRADFSMLDS